MFPVKGTTVWVNFREKPYLGKVLQTSPELNMVCVRISNYLDYVSRDSDQTDLVAHSCPVSNQSLLSNRHSSVVITCGLEDVCLIESNNDPHFANKHHESSNDNNSEIIIESNPVQIPKNFNNRDIGHNNSLRNNLQDTNSLEDENELSNSFGIKKLLKSSDIEDTKSFAQNNKYWQCWHCYIFLSNENDMHLHVINKHKLETILDRDNWIVIGGIRGLDYDEVNSQENCNIKDLNNIHISTSSRKRQFFDSTSALSLSLSNDFQNQSYSYSAINHSKGESYKACNDADSSFNELGGQNNWSHLNGIVNNNNVEYLDGILNPSYNQINFADFNTLTNDQVSYNRKIQFFQSILLQHQINSTLSSAITNSSNADNLPYRLRSNSDQLSSHVNHMQTCLSSESKEIVQEILSPTKRSRIETGIKKCRKMYGIDQRHLWCNQCKWKKACSRFLSEINLN